MITSGKVLESKLLEEETTQRPLDTHYSTLGITHKVALRKLPYSWIDVEMDFRIVVY